MIWYEHMMKAGIVYFMIMRSALNGEYNANSFYQIHFVARRNTYEWINHIMLNLRHPAASSPPPPAPLPKDPLIVLGDYPLHVIWWEPTMTC